MKRLIAVATALIVSTGTARAQDFQPPKPAPEHDFLKKLAGTWDAVSKFHSPDGPVEGKGVETNRLIAGGLFLTTDFKGTSAGEKFVGHGIIGFDTHRKKYTGTWVDNMSTAIWNTVGELSKDGKTYTSTMEGPDPNTGQPIKMKAVQKITGTDTRELKFSMAIPDSDDILIGSITYTRRKK